MTALDPRWLHKGTSDPDIIAELQEYAAFLRKARRVTQAGTTGRPMPISATDGVEVVEKARGAALREVEATIERGRLDESLAPADYLYALNLLYQPPSLFAASAERETAEYLNYLSGGNLLDLTEAKTVNQQGPDGLFVGGIPSLNISTWMGLEVKTTVSFSSLTSNIDSMLQRLCTSSHNKHDVRCIDKADPQEWRTNSLALAVKSLMALGQFELAERLNDAGQWGFRTILVIRATSLEEIKVPERARRFFDLILPFDLFGYPEYDASMSSGSGAIPGWAYDELYNLAGDFNGVKARVALAEYYS